MEHPLNKHKLHLCLTAVGDHLFDPHLCSHPCGPCSLAARSSSQVAPWPFPEPRCQWLLTYTSMHAMYVLATHASGRTPCMPSQTVMRSLPCPCRLLWQSAQCCGWGSRTFFSALLTSCRHRPAYMYDATISYPMADHDSVPAWASYSIPFILFIITVSSNRSLTSAV